MAPVTLNLAMLGTLRDATTSNAHAFQEIIETFLSSVGDRVRALREAITDGNATRLRKLLHSLKGSTGSLGAERLRSLCITLEKQALSSSPEGTKTLCDELEAEFACVQEALIAEIEV